MITLRLRTRTHPETLKQQVGKHLTATDYSLLLTQAATVLKPNGQPLCVYLPGQLSKTLANHPEVYDILHGLRSHRTDNRGLASGSRRILPPGQKRSRTRLISSSILGAADPMGTQPYCRLTAWTGQHVPQWERLQPYLAGMAEAFEQHVPDRYAVQMDRVRNTHPDWVVPGTPYTTITVNNTYSTGVHQDAGDLAEGFSCLGVLRRGHYTGGCLTFPEWRVAVDMQDGDLLLMDAHDWHGNTELRCAHGRKEYDATGCEQCASERISVVAYYRQKMTQCGSAGEEHRKAAAAAERRSGGGKG